MRIAIPKYIFQKYYSNVTCSASYPFECQCRFMKKFGISKYWLLVFSFFFSDGFYKKKLRTLERFHTTIL